jgi:hypothetical protein
VLDDQKLYFEELYRVVRAAAEGKSPAEVQSAVEKLKAELSANARITRYVGSQLAAQVAKVYNEITGKSFPDKRAEAAAQGAHLARHHGRASSASAPPSRR